MTRKFPIIELLVIAAFFLLMFLLLSSCRSHKDISQTVRNVDSTAMHVRDSFAHVISEINDKHAKELQEASSSKVEFDYSDPLCPPVDCDSTELEHYRSVVKSLQNKVTIDEKGKVTYEGKIKSAQQEANKWSKEVDELGIRVDQLVQQHYKDSLALEASLKTKEKTVDRKSGGFFSWWWLFPAGVIGGIGLLALWQQKRKKKISI